MASVMVYVSTGKARKVSIPTIIHLRMPSVPPR